MIYFGFMMFIFLFNVFVGVFIFECFFIYEDMFMCWFEISSVIKIISIYRCGF